MDSRLSEASKTGDIQLLHQLMAENPLLLHNLALTSSENPLHVASLAGHVEFVQEIAKLRPAFVHEMNHDGFSPMHIAAANGYLEVVRELLRVDPRLCRMKGRDQWTPLHYAAARGRGDVVGEMVLACPESLEDVTLHEETSLHLAVNNCQFEAVKILVELVMELRKDNVLNMKDKNGNSVLHVATWKEQHQVVEWLVGNGKTPSALELNIVNQSGLTPLDLLLIFPSEAGDREIEGILRGAGASRAQDIQYTPSHGPMETNTLQLQQPNNPMEYFNFKMGRDSPSDARTALLVVAVLVATATFQAGLSPPGGVWQDSTGSNMNGTGRGSNEQAHSAGKSIMGSDDNIFFCLLCDIQLDGIFCFTLHDLCPHHQFPYAVGASNVYSRDVRHVQHCSYQHCTGEPDGVRLSVNLWFANFAFTCPTLAAFQDQA